MAQCHVVHLGRDSRLLATTIRIRREPPDSLIVDFDYRGQIVPVTEIRMTNTQALALADELTDGLVTRLTSERDEALVRLSEARRLYQPRWKQETSSNLGGEQGSMSGSGLPGGSSPTPSTGTRPPDVE